MPAQSLPPEDASGAVWDAAAPCLSPTWFGPVQTASGANMTVWRAAIRPPAGQSRLAVTLLFEESQGGFARLIWLGPGRAVTICGNLYEGAAPLHLRTLLLDRETLAGPGQLVLEATGTRPVLARAELFWVEPLVLAAPGDRAPGLYLAPSGRIFPADELRGEGRRAPSDEKKGRMIDAVLDAGPVKIQPRTPVRFVAPFTGSPSHARIEAQVAGLAPGEEPSLWVNGRPIAAVSVELPGLEDAGYRWTADGFSYGGWRTVTAMVPSGWITAGENQIDWHCPDAGAGITVRNIRLQVAYDAAGSVWRPASTAPPGVAASSAGFSPAPSAPPVAPTAPRLRLGLSSSSATVGLRPE